MSQSLKVFFACALGAFIGSFIALDVLSLSAWLELPIGMIVGGLIGYTSYDFRAVMQAIPKAWTLSRANFGKGDPMFALLATTTGACIGLTFGMVLFGCSTIFMINMGDQNANWLTFLTWTIGTSALFALCVATHCVVLAKRYNAEERIEAKKDFLTIILFANPLSASALGIRYLGKFAWKGLIHTPRAIWETMKFFWQICCCIARFAKHLFILIHSDVRLLCGVDAAVGVAAGYVAGNAVLGAILGGLSGLLNFWFISVKWLKLIPARAQN